MLRSYSIVRTARYGCHWFPLKYRYLHRILLADKTYPFYHSFIVAGEKQCRQECLMENSCDDDSDCLRACRYGCCEDEEADVLCNRSVPALACEEILSVLNFRYHVSSSQQLPIGTLALSAHYLNYPAINTLQHFQVRREALQG